MGRISALAVCFALLAQAAQAQQLIAGYYTTIGPNDLFNSGGARLTSLGQILQQDRANLHRFGRPDPFDQSDPVFADQALRARIPDLYAAGPGEDLIERIVLQGNALEVFVQLCGNAGSIRYLVVEFADGDSRRGC